MGVQVPRLKEIESTGNLPSIGRTNAKAQSQADNILGNVKAISSAMKTGSEIAEHFENETANEISDKNNLQLSDWDKQAAGTISAKLKADPFADPSKLYSDFDDAKEAKYKALIDANPEANERVKGIVKANLDKKMQSTRSADLQQRSYHKEIYQNNIYQATLKNNQEQLPKLAAYIREDDRSSSLDFDKGVHVMKTAIVKRAMSTYGAVKVDKRENSNFTYVDAENKQVFVKVNKSTQSKIAEQTGEGVKNSINSMISSNQIEKAEAMLKWYGDSLSTKSRTAINNKLSKKIDDNQAYVEVAKIGTLPESKRSDAIDKIKNEKVKKKVLEIEVTNTKRRDYLEKRQQDKNNEVMTSKADEMIRNGQVHGFSDLEKSPGFDEVFNNMSPKQQRALRERFNAPTVSDPESEERMLNFFLGDSKLDPEKVTAGQFSELKEGLSKTKRKQADDMLLRRRNRKNKLPVATYNSASKLLVLTLQDKGIIKKDRYGKFKGDNLKDKNAALLYLNSNMDDYDEPTTQKELGDLVENMTNRMNKDKLFGSNDSWFSWSNDNKETKLVTPSATPNNIKDPVAELTSRSIAKLQQAYRRKTGVLLPPDNPKFITYINSLSNKTLIIRK